VLVVAAIYFTVQSLREMRAGESVGE